MKNNNILKIGSGVINDISSTLAKSGIKGKLLYVSDPVVDSLYGSTVKSQLEQIGRLKTETVDHNTISYSMSVAERVIATDIDCIIGLGGGKVLDVCKYASVEFDKVLEDDVYNMTKVTEKPKKGEAKSDLSPLGRYVCSPQIFDIIRNLEPGASGEYQFTDALDIEAQTRGALAYVFKGTRYDMGDRFGYLKANIEYGLRDAELSEKLKEYLKDLVK